MEDDLSVYRQKFGLPECSTRNGCLSIIAPNGAPAADDQWSAETAIDVEMVSAICPLCKITIVEALSANIGDLAAAVDKAASLHPAAISNSYAVPEAEDNTHFKDHYHHDGMAIVAGAGDTGYGVNFPASAATVVAVGGTSVLQKPDGTFAAPTVWAGTGSGCSAFISKPSYQHDTGCKNRTANDIAALADPETGVIAYTNKKSGWAVYGGTSVATPIVAALYALSGNATNVHDPSNLYANASLLYSIRGSNGVCSPAYLCNAGSGFSGPAGNGVPYGIAAFGPPLPSHH
ncbi:MAG: peptidase S8 [Candidatus Eremiobacteraeota bacterium]|nr:peptidase S8 [Candidatus Eremiobacteraeota bacterium]